MGSPDFAVPSLEALVGAAHDVAAAYCQPPRPAGRGKSARSWTAYNADVGTAGAKTLSANDGNWGYAVEVKVAEGEVGSDKPLYIGSSAVGYPWQGKIDEVRKWSRALSEDEQRELFRDPPETPGPTRR